MSGVNSLLGVADLSFILKFWRNFAGVGFRKMKRGRLSVLWNLPLFQFIPLRNSGYSLVPVVFHLSIQSGICVSFRLRNW